MVILQSQLRYKPSQQIVYAIQDEKICLAAETTTLDNFVNFCLSLRNKFGTSKIILSGEKKLCEEQKEKLQNTDFFKNTPIEIKGE